jgi:neutral ceramidase
VSSPLRAGVASANITPPVGTWLCGFAGRPTPATGVHDELLAKALVLDDGKTTLAIVTSDLIGLGYDMVREIREMIHGQTGIPPEHVMLSASHTHSGPVTAPLHAMGVPDEAYLQVLKYKIAGAVCQAYESRRAARIGFGVGPAQVGINRRQRTDQGMQLGRNEEGVVDPHVYVVRVDFEAPWPQVVLFSHAAHPVTLGSSNLLVSADYPGVAQRVIEQVEPGATALFAQGCCGNINSDPVGGTFEDARRLGAALGAAAVATAEQTATSDQARLRALARTLGLPTQPPPPAEEIEAQAARHRENLQRARAEGAPEGTLRMHQGLVDWSQWVAGLAAAGSRGMALPFEVQAFAFDGAAIVALSGEVFVEIALAIQEQSAFEPTIVLGYTNGCVGYVWPRKVWEEGGYEPAHSIMYYGTLPLEPGAGEMVVEAAVEALRSL